MFEPQHAYTKALLDSKLEVAGSQAANDCWDDPICEWLPFLPADGRGECFDRAAGGGGAGGALGRELSRCSEFPIFKLVEVNNLKMHFRFAR